MTAICSGIDPVVYIVNLYKNRRLNYLSMSPFSPVLFFTFADQAGVEKYGLKNGLTL
jgi:hypothetical protein